MKLLILLPRVPYPLEKGDKLRAFYQLKELSKYHEIYLIALNRGVLHPEAKAKVMPFCKRIDFLDLPIIRQAFGVVRAFLLATNGSAREAAVPLTFLPKNQDFVATIYSDGDDAHWKTNPTSYKIEKKIISHNDTLFIDMAAGGGCAVTLSPRN